MKGGYRYRRRRKLKVLVVGYGNNGARFIKGYKRYRKWIELLIVDKAERRENLPQWAREWAHFEQISGNEELIALVEGESYDVVFVETEAASRMPVIETLVTHGQIDLLLTEKGFCSARDVSSLIAMATSHGVEIRVIDHYLGDDQVRQMIDTVLSELGPIREVDIRLAEDKGVPENTRHMDIGSADTYFHACTICSRFGIRFKDLVLKEALQARDSQAPKSVPNTFLFTVSEETGTEAKVTLGAAKYQKVSYRVVTATDIEGNTAIYNRESKELKIEWVDDEPKEFRLKSSDAGYGKLIGSLVNKRDITALTLSLREAWEIQRKIDEAIKKARMLNIYPTDLLCALRIKGAVIAA